MWQLPWKPPKNNIQQNGLKIASWSHDFNYDLHHDHHHGPSFTNKSDPARRFTISVGDTSHDDWWTKFQTASWDGQNIDQFGFLTLVWNSIVLAGANQVRQASLAGIGCLASPAARGICHFHNEKRFQSYDHMSHPALHNYKIERIRNTFPKHAKSYIVFPSQLTLDPVRKWMFNLTQHLKDPLQNLLFLIPQKHGYFQAA